MYPLVLDCKKIKKDRGKIIQDLRKIGINCYGGFYNLHLLPLYKYKNKYLNKKFPIAFKKKNTIEKCPVAENLHKKTFIFFQLASYKYTINDADKIVQGFKKLWKKYGIE